MTDTTLTPDEARELLGAPSGSRPRIYALTLDGSAILRIHSTQYLDQYADNISKLWLSNATTADFIRKA